MLAGRYWLGCSRWLSRRWSCWREAVRPAGGPLPDERVHQAFAELGSRAAWRRAQAEYLAEPRAWVYPPPLRWLAWVVVRWRWWPVPTPLGWVLRGRALADAPVGVAWALAVLSGSPLVCGLAALFCLGLKEGSLALVPVLVVASGWAGLPWVAAGVAAWALVTTAVCGRAWVRVLTRSVLEQGHRYTRDFQSGGLLRVAADAMLAGGWWWLAAAWLRVGGPAVWAAVVALVVQGLGPVQNVRVSVGPDLVVRAVVVASLLRESPGDGLSGHGPAGVLLVLLGIGVDAWTAWRLRDVRDPVTMELGRALGRS